MTWLRDTTHDMTLFYVPPEHFSILQALFQDFRLEGLDTLRGQVSSKGKSGSGIDALDPELTTSGVLNVAGEEPGAEISDEAPFVLAQVGSGKCSLHTGYAISSGEDLKSFRYAYLSGCYQACSTASDCAGWTARHYVVKRALGPLTPELTFSGCQRTIPPCTVAMHDTNQRAKGPLTPEFTFQDVKVPFRRAIHIKTKNLPKIRYANPNFRIRS
jgi:hypothetical protein